MTISDDSEPTDASVGTREVCQFSEDTFATENASGHKKPQNRECIQRQTEPLELSLKIKLTERDKERLSRMLVDYTSHICSTVKSDYSNVPIPQIKQPNEQEIPLRRPTYRTWLRIKNGMQAHYLRARHFMALAYNLNSTSFIYGTEDTQILARIGALRLATATSEQPELAIAAKFALLADFNEYLTNAQITERRKVRIWKLYRITTHDLSILAPAVFDNISAGFWTKSLYCWLREIVSAHAYGLIPDDWLFQRAADELAIFANSRKATEGTVNAQFEAQAEGTTSKPEVTLQSNNARRYKRILKHLDLAQFGESKKQEYAQGFNNLTNYLPLTSLPSFEELKTHLESLKTEMPNFAPIIDMLSAGFALQTRSAKPPILYLRPLLIIGPPAIGKTRFVKKLAALLGASWSMMIPSGEADNRNFAGTARGFSSGHPSWAVEQIQKLNCANPILVLDEIEKAGGSSINGFLAHSLLPFLETESSKIYNDPFLGGPMDLSGISWVLMANTVDGLSEPLRSRVNIVKVRPPGPEMFGIIFQNVLTEISEDLGIDRRLLPNIPPAYVAWLKDEYSRAPDIRRLRTKAEILLNKIVSLEDNPAYNTIH